MTEERSETRALRPIQDIIKRQGHEKVVLLIDSSGSMNGLMPATGTGGVQIKLAAACEAVMAITNVSDPALTRYGVVHFESNPHQLFPITDDYFTIQMDITGGKIHPGGGTDMAAGISYAVHMDPNRIILLSDGEPTCPEEKLWTIVDSAHDLGIRIDTISIGDANDKLMEEIARRTGGVFARSNDTAQLAAHFMRLETRAYLAIEHKS